MKYVSLTPTVPKSSLAHSRVAAPALHLGTHMKQHIMWQEMCTILNGCYNLGGLLPDTDGWWAR